jgi:hypothetical protein
VGASNLALLPPQLENFNLEAHVGLVRRMFSVDPNLVEMHANLSGILVYALPFFITQLSCSLKNAAFQISLY